MNFANLGAFSFLAGLAVIAGLLFVLQRLRVRFREREVVTTLFWKQALEETRARMMTRRFRHPWSYLLALAICVLIWLAFAQPGWNREADENHVFLLDTSAGMSEGSRFEEAKALLLEEVGRVSADRRRVYVCGADARLILDHGEEASLLDTRLEDLQPEASPSNLESELLAVAAENRVSGKLRILVVGDAPVRESVLDQLPASVAAERLRSSDFIPPESNVGITALGLAEAASGSFERVDVMIEIVGTENPSLSISLGGQPFQATPTKEAGAYYLRDLPARGEILEVRLVSDDAMTLDNRARIKLPDRQRIKVSVDGNLDERFRAVIDADPALVSEAAGAQVAVGGAADGSLPAIELVTGKDIAIIHDADLDANGLEELKARFAGIGLDRVGWKLGSDSEPIAGFTLSPRFVPGPQSRVQIGVELIGENSDFMQTTAFPLFISTAIHWLADVESIEPFAIAGQRSVHRGQFALAGSDYAPPRAGLYSGRNGEEIEVSLAAIGSPQADALSQVSRSTASSRWPNLFAWCVLIALLMIVGEWWLFQKSYIP